MLIVRGVVVLPVNESFCDALILVRLLDVNVIDAPARVVGEKSFLFSGGPVDRIPFELAFEETSASARMTLSAEIRTRDPAHLHRGDWVTTRTTNTDMQALKERGAVVSVDRIH